MSSVVRNVEGYPTSTDYGALWELAQRQGVVCLVNYGDSDSGIVDVAHTLATTEPYVSVGVRGCSYVTAWDEPSFVRQCQKVNLRWLVPVGVQP